MMKKRLETIKEVLKQRKYLLIFLISAMIYSVVYYFIINFFLNGFSQLFTTYVKSYAYTAFSLNIIVALLLGVNISMLVYRFKSYATE
jgi:uncharacterized membrane protein YdjX (TVP38/TMEM64 family)|tara:strand:- start:196 stop:459 length:264 start_codon:yes stop_codon:yes gene_type:complete